MASTLIMSDYTSPVIHVKEVTNQAVQTLHHSEGPNVLPVDRPGATREPADALGGLTWGFLAPLPRYHQLYFMACTRSDCIQEQEIHYHASPRWLCPFY